MSHGCNVQDCPGDCRAAEGEDLGAEVRRLRAECARKIEPLSDDERFAFLFAIAGVAIELAATEKVPPETEAALYRWLDRCQGKVPRTAEFERAAAEAEKALDIAENTKTWQVAREERDRREKENP